eukprot:CAMPEP_0171100244 /NCGR_PEP_ID=MMETSP0766_2-20121228/52844_1 /TAXON_ID=439317 /ORGANISM="Gambierdiscus australes, Strain CAWD 149" /LENGTH=54 /DNA_ID=CAMNT_0011560037 /DNA_START=613 /DNA_END=774 /DNA_ORIENTATION=+
MTWATPATVATVTEKVGPDFAGVRPPLTRKGQPNMQPMRNACREDDGECLPAMW